MPARWDPPSIPSPESDPWEVVGGNGGDSPVTEDVTHRPWPLPRSPWVIFMRWNDLAFLHWPIRPDVVRPLVPDSLELETYEGRAWIGVTPFWMSQVRARLTPSLPRISTFPELNVRTYVSAGGKPGVWFLSLDAANGLAVRAARWAYGLPYFLASMSVTPGIEWFDYRSVRDEDPDVRFHASYGPTDTVRPSEPGTLEHWLTERYCLYSLRGGRLCRSDIHHAPWPLQSASAAITENTMAEPAGISLDRDPPLVHFARRLDVVAWLPVAVEE
jgi:uncharacterized protein